MSRAYQINEKQLIEVLAVDFEQPRVLWQKVWNDQQREAYVKNVAGHFGGVKSAVVRDRQRKFSVPACLTPRLTVSNSLRVGRC